MTQPRKKGGRRGNGMSRRELLQAGVTGSLAVAVGRVVPAAVRGSAETAPVQAAPFELEEATIAQLQAEMNAGTHTARSLAEAYLGRIEAIDPSLRSVIEVNPDAVAIAVALDAERKAKGPRGPLHGIPVVVKDNIATADRMATTAGSLALVGAKAPRDSFVAERLRAAGAVILGKTNLSEWANFRSSRSSSGWITTRPLLLSGIAHRTKHA
ncbi:MAG TPA: amidase family protein, partial [Thermoanaerobaculaceae bacterium]|nr:amidase family protein [Thermoanaerobaculaceae bacterium]